MPTLSALIGPNCLRELFCGHIMTRSGSGSAKRSDSGQKGNIKNFFAKKEEEAAKEVSASGDASEAKAKSPGHSPGKTSDYESEVGIADLLFSLKIVVNSNFSFQLGCFPNH